jgi:hypothetical protein
MTLFASAAHADGEIDVASTSTYVLRAKQRAVSATITITVHNNRPSGRAGNDVQQFSLPSISIPVPADAEQLTATSSGTALSISRAASQDPSTAIATIAFPSNVLYGQSRAVTVRFLLRGAKPRSPAPTRVGPGYASFAVFGPGDPGHNTVEVVLPGSMTFDATTEAFTRHATGATVTYTATRNNEDSGFWAIVSARDPEVSRSKRVIVGQQWIRVVAYRDDPRWLSFVSSQMRTGVPVLEKLIGTTWPGGVSTVREDRGVTVRGYDGWFDPTVNEIVIGEGLDQELLLHELTHAWATPETLGQRWIYEGIAQDLAARGVTELGRRPRSPVRISPRDRRAFPLNDWGLDRQGRSQAANAFAYPAAAHVMKALLDGADGEARSRLLGAAVAGDSAFGIPGEEDLAGVTDWRRLLDLVQVMGRNDSAPAVLKTWILTPDQRGLLTARSKALTDYRDLDRADGALAPPLGLRRAMTAWDFDTVHRSIAQLRRLAPRVAELQAVAERNHQDLPKALAALYEGADTSAEYSSLDDLLAQATTALDAVAKADQAAAARRNPFSALGARILGINDKAAQADRLLSRADFAAAEQQADEAVSANRRTTKAGLAVVLGALLLAIVLMPLARRLRRRRSARTRARQDQLRLREETRSAKSDSWAAVVERHRVGEPAGSGSDQEPTSPEA